MNAKDSDQRTGISGAGTSQTVYDLESSLARLGGSQDLFRSLAEFFLEDCPGLHEQIRNGIESGDAMKVERAGHSVKGLAANFGAAATVEAAAKIEDFGRARDIAAARGALPELETELQRLQLALSDYLRTPIEP